MTWSGIRETGIRRLRWPACLFEVVEIGAVKLNDDCIMVNEFSQLVKPQVYHEMNQITGRLIHLQMQELERGKPFAETAEAFLTGAGRRSIFSAPGAVWI